MGELADLTILAPSGQTAVAWASLLERLPPESRDIHFTPDYALAHQLAYGNPVRLAVYREGDGLVLMPFVLRSIDSLPFAEACRFERPSYDVTSLYAFGGPIAAPGSDDRRTEGLPQRFHAAFHAFCRDEGIVAQFTAFHPLIGNHRLAKRAGVETRYRKDVVWLDLMQAEDRLWHGLSHGCRNDVRRARAEGVAVEWQDPDVGALSVFADLYAVTMLRVGAASRWDLPADYLGHHARRLGSERMSIVTATQGGSVVAAGLVFLQHGTAYYHLAGSRSMARRLGANHLLVLELALGAKARGCRSLILGGGVEAEDGVFAFKAGFSRLRAPFYTAATIHDPEAYQRLIEAKHGRDGRGSAAPSDYFPAYREP